MLLTEPEAMSLHYLPDQSEMNIEGASEVVKDEPEEIKIRVPYYEEDKHSEQADKQNTSTSEQLAEHMNNQPTSLKEGVNGSEEEEDEAEKSGEASSEVLAERLVESAEQEDKQNIETFEEEAKIEQERIEEEKKEGLGEDEVLGNE